MMYNENRTNSAKKATHLQQDAVEIANFFNIVEDMLKHDGSNSSPSVWSQTS